MDQAIDVNLKRAGQSSLDRRLATYATAAGALGVAMANDADGAIVANRTQQPFGINQEVSIDFNSDGQIDFQIDHDRVDLNGTNIDYLQIDKSDVNGASNPTFIPPSNSTFPTNGTTPNDSRAVVSFLNPDSLTGGLGGYPVALKQGDTIGPDLMADASWDYQEGNNINGTGRWVRANRLIDEDATQIDQAVGGRTVDQVYLPYKPDPPSENLDDWIGLNGATRYLGVRVDLNNQTTSTDYNYGWIGVRIDNEADATGVVTGWAYETDRAVGIIAGDSGPVAPGDYDGDGKVAGGDFLVWQQQFGSTVAAGTGADGNGDTLVNGADLNTWKGAFGTATGAGAAVPEPSSTMMALLGSALICACWLFRRRRLRASS